MPIAPPRPCWTTLCGCEYVSLCVHVGVDACVGLCTCLCLLISPECGCQYECVHVCAWWSICAPAFPPLSLVLTCISYALTSLWQSVLTTLLATVLSDLPYFLGGRDISSSLMRRLSCLPAAEVPWSDGHVRRPWSSVTPQLVHRCAKMHSFPYGQPLGAVLNSLHTALLGLLAACFRVELPLSPSCSVERLPFPFGSVRRLCFRDVKRIFRWSLAW